MFIEIVSWRGSDNCLDSAISNILGTAMTAQLAYKLLPLQYLLYPNLFNRHVARLS